MTPVRGGCPGPFLRFCITYFNEVVGCTAVSSRFGKELAIAVSAVRKASSFYSGSRECSDKATDTGVYDVVTSCDIDLEGSLISSLKGSFPGDVFISEENGGEPLTDERTWVIDPIDGTVNFARGIPLYGTQLALLVNRLPVLAVIYLPAYDEMYTATESDGARLNGDPISVSEDRPLRDSIISTGDYSRRSVKFRTSQASVMNMMYDCVARVKMFGASCCDFAFFASGRTDLHLRFVNNLWDFVPGMFIAETAGGHYDRAYLEKHSLLIFAPSKEMCDAFCRTVLDSCDL